MIFKRAPKVLRLWILCLNIQKINNVVKRDWLSQIKAEDSRNFWYEMISVFDSSSVKEMNRINNTSCSNNNMSADTIVLPCFFWWRNYFFRGKDISESHWLVSSLPSSIKRYNYFLVLNFQNYQKKNCLYFHFWDWFVIWLIDNDKTGLKCVKQNLVAWRNGEYGSWCFR